MIKIKNISGQAATLHIHSFAIDEMYSIPTEELIGWAYNDDVIEAITNAEFQIYDHADVEVVGVARQLDYLRGQTPIDINSQPPFAEPLYRTKHDAHDQGAVIAPDSFGTIDYYLYEDLYVHGGRIIGYNCKPGDYICASIYDSDEVIPEAYRAALCEDWPIVAQYILREWLPVDPVTGFVVLEIDTKPLIAKITSGLYLRVGLHTTAEGIDRQIFMNYYMLKRL